MDLSHVLTFIAAVLGTGGIGGLLFYRERARKLKADATSAEVANMQTVIDTMRGQIDRLYKRLEHVETCVNTLEQENVKLRRKVEQVRSLVRRLWNLVQEADLETDARLKEAVFEALEESEA